LGKTFFFSSTNNNILQARYRPPALQIDVIMSLHEILEKDEAGNVTATYVGMDKGSRVDVVVCVIFPPPFLSGTLDRRLCSTPCMLSIIWIGFLVFFECPFLLMKNVSCVEFSCRKNPKATPTDYLMCFYLRDIRRV